MSFGCSFTQGGGLNSQKFHAAVNNRDWNNDDIMKFYGHFEEILPEHMEYSNTHSFPGYLSKILNCDFINFAKSGASNDLIFKRAFEEAEKIENPQEVLLTVQASFFNRIHLQIPSIETDVNINTLDTIPHILPYRHSHICDYIHQYYSLYLGYFYDEKYEYEKLRRNIELFSAYCREKNLDVVFLLYEDPQYEKRIDNSNLVDLGGYKDLSDLSYRGELTITHYTQGRFHDLHFSPEGNKKIAMLISDHLIKNGKL